MCEHWHRDHCNGFEKLLGEQTPTADSDTISRQAAIIQLSHNKIGDDDCDVIIQRDIETIKQLPSAEPKRMRAKWIATTALQEGQITWRDYKCSNCSHHRGKPINYCEVCGAKMER